ncbi:BPSL0761 family protein [Pseudomonas matsuisoli]|uniref:Uncharacterized protein n=1 Tax=Pseudomonas matsuisoli TaxID=1515666 RepID=A0A917PPJ7_9PSED|nr:BPSL0761 family protein [Pseudomonas matsuisoli]GGJ86913.1 hypothetical protein GCM10009304_11140 [Pseudomonas matsuisoli]
MTMPHERSRAVVQTRDFLVELSKDRSLPEKIRQDAKFLLRHFPDKREIRMAGLIEKQVANVPSIFAFPVFSSTLEFHGASDPNKVADLEEQQSEGPSQA